MNTNRLNLVTSWVPPIAWMLIIFAASTDLGSAEHTSRYILPLLRWLRPGISLEGIAAVQFVIRKAAHVTEYAILGALLLRAISSRSGRPRWQYAAVALIVAATYAAFDEYHQAFVPSRTASSRDVAIDVSGAALGLALCWLGLRWRSRLAADAPLAA